MKLKFVLAGAVLACVAAAPVVAQDDQHHEEHHPPQQQGGGHEQGAQPPGGHGPQGERMHGPQGERTHGPQGGSPGAQPGGTMSGPPHGNNMMGPSHGNNMMGPSRGNSMMMNGGDRGAGHNRNFDRHAYQRNFTAPRRFRAGGYERPHGWYEHRWTFGEVLPAFFWTQNYWLGDYYDYGLAEPPPGFVWVRYGSDALLIDQNSGEVLQVEYDVFY